MKKECARFLQEVHLSSFGTVKDGKHSGEVKVHRSARHRAASSVNKGLVVYACCATMERNSTRTKTKFHSASNPSSIKIIYTQGVLGSCPMDLNSF